MKYAAGFLRGAALPFKALALFTKNMKYWPYLTWPVVINVILYIIGLVLFWNYLLPFSDSMKVTPNPEAWYSWFLDAYNWSVGFTITLTAAAFFLFSGITINV